MQNLENELREIITFRVKGVQKVKSTTKVDVVEETKPPESPSKLSIPTDIAWKAINAYQAALLEKEAKDKFQNDLIKKSKLREDLMKQMNASKEIEIQEKTKDVSYAARVLTDVERYKMEEAEKQRIIQEKANIQRKFREEQIADQARRRKDEEEAARLHEQQRIEAIKREIERDQQNLQHKKLTEVERQKKILEENESLRLHRLEQKKKDAEYDQLLMRQYAEKMDREAEEREQAFSKRMSVLEKFATKFSQEGAGKVQKEEMIREERLLLAEQERKEKADAAEEKRRRELSKKRQQDAARTNLEMIKQQQLKAEQDRINDQRLTKMSEEELNKWKKQEEAKLRKQAESKLKFKSVLTQQIREKEKFAKLGEMSEVEVVMNKNVLSAIENADEEIQVAIKKRLQI